MQIILLALLVALQKPAAPAPKPKLVVEWWTSADLAKVAATRTNCDEPVREVKEMNAELLVCANADPNLAEDVVWPSRGKCAPKASRSVPLDMRGTITFDDPPRGAHFVRFTVGAAPPVYRLVRVHGGEDSIANAEVRWFSFFGKVTRNDEPQFVQLYGAVTDPDSGEYVAYLARDPGAYTQRIVSCRGFAPYQFVPDKAPAENVRFDVEIPSNRVVVEVVDGRTGDVLPGARVSHSALKDVKKGYAHYSGPGADADAKGIVVLDAIVPNVDVHICAEHDRYEKRCTETFKLAADETKNVRLALDEIVRREGRVFANGKIEVGQIHWYSPTGERKESIYVGEDGSFGYKRPHAAGEIVVFTSPTHPLYAFVMPHLADDQPFDIQLPLARVRSVEVHLAATATEGAGFTVALGDLIVPGTPLTQHLARRNHSGTLMPGASTVVADIFETAPMSVVMAPLSFWQGRTQSNIDLFLLPEARTLPRKVVGDGGRVDF